jgi:hypothetical protein
VFTYRRLFSELVASSLVFTAVAVATPAAPARAHAGVRHLSDALPEPLLAIFDAPQVVGAARPQYLVLLRIVLRVTDVYGKNGYRMSHYS